MKRDEILDEAKRLITTERETQHGDAADGFRRVALAWSGILGTPVAPHQVPFCMAALKLVRACSGSSNPDDAIDAGGYSALGGEMISNKE